MTKQTVLSWGCADNSIPFCTHCTSFYLHPYSCPNYCLLQNWIVGSVAAPPPAGQFLGVLHHGNNRSLVLCYYHRAQIWYTWLRVPAEWWVSNLTLSPLFTLSKVLKRTLCLPQKHFSDVPEWVSPHPSTWRSFCWPLSQSAGCDPQHELCVFQHCSGKLFLACNLTCASLQWLGLLSKCLFWNAHNCFKFAFV